MQQENESQANLYQERRTIKHSTRPLQFERHHRAFFAEMIRKNKLPLFLMLAFILLQSLIEIAALLFLNTSLRERIYGALHTQTIIPLVAFAIAGAGIYLFVTYASIKYERKIVLELINDLRSRWFSILLHRQPKNVTNEMKADFIAKVSYHLPLLSLGMDHSIFGCLRWLLTASILIGLGLFAGPLLLKGIFIAIVTSLIMGSIAYAVAHHYISQEVTSYSQVIKHMMGTLAEFASTKRLYLEAAAMEGLATRVGIDTHFRIRRDIWLRYFNRVLFTVLFVFSIVAFAIAFSHPGLISFFYNPASTILAAIISLYAFRLFYESVQTGLYLPPLRLGIFLSVPDRPLYHFDKQSKKPWKEISFRSNKTRLFPEGDYFKNVSLSFKPGSTHFFVGPGQSGKTNLAGLLGGRPEFNQNGWLITMGTKRGDAKYWVSNFKDRYFFEPHFNSEKTIGELVFGKEKHLITEEDITKAHSVCETHPAFSPLLKKKRFLGESARTFEGNAPALFAIQTLYCILNKTSFIVIDNHWLDLQYEEIKEMLRVLRSALPRAALIMFSRSRLEMITDAHHYEIKKGYIQSA
jgi:hypothetical protein